MLALALLLAADDVDALKKLAGTKDESIPQQDARRYHQAASQPKEVRWYAAGHELNCTVNNIQRKPHRILPFRAALDD